MCGYETYTVENPKDLDYALIYAHMAFCEVYLETEGVKGYEAIRRD